ncbi:membrane protein insertase YidC [Candidatus Parcubacteria bacterium]|nr:MAG: membrane protein insertase YidC [Candidatus Parcubacteria bacterium]
MITQAYEVVFYQPLLNILTLFYGTIALGDLGLAIIFLTILIRIILFPIFSRSARHQSVMQRLQPKLKHLQDVHRHDKEKQVQAMMSLYKEHKINPFSGFLFLLAQLPFLIALYHIFLNVFKPDFLDGLYPFVSRPEAIQPFFLGLIDLGRPSILMVGLAALGQYFQGKLAIPPKREEEELSDAERLGRRMIVIGPLLTLLIFYNLPAAISLYWATTSVFSVFQQWVINRELNHGKVGTTGKTTDGVNGVS